MIKFLTLAILLLVAGISNLLPTPSQPSVLAESTQASEILDSSQPIKTDSRFGSKLETTTQTIERKVVTNLDPNSEYGVESVTEEGSDGKIIKTIKITFYEGEEFAKEVTNTETIPPKDKIITKGTKITWHTLDTPSGPVQYWRKVRVYATHYDSRCPGCNEWTATGMRAGKGVIAVDPKVIKLYTKVYIPKYGIAIAGDTGGAIKGSIIDLGFEDARTAGWYAHYIDIYLLDKIPADATQ